MTGLAQLLHYDSHVVYIGTKLRAVAGLRGYGEIVRDLFLATEEIGSRRDAALATEAIDRGDYDVGLELLEQKLSRERLVSMLREAMRRPAEPPPIYAVLASIPFAGVITDSIDPLAERAFLKRQPFVATPRNVDDAVQRLDESPFIVLKLFGDSADPASVLLTMREYSRTVRRTPNVERLLSWMLQRSAVFFVGASLDTVQNLLSQYEDLRRSRTRHVAFISAKTENAPLKRLVSERYGVRLVEYDEDRAGDLLSRLREVSLELDTGFAARKVISGSLHDPEGPLTRVRLSNIGPFERADVRIARGWNVVLGDNGAGKSTLLRAVALALAGDTPAADVAAASLLNTRASRGSIQLNIGGREFRTELLRTTRGVRVESTDVSPLDTVRRVALGFPALRGISARELLGPSTVDLTGDIKSSGLVPLLLGDADSRLNDVEQVIVNAFAAEMAPPIDLPARDRAHRFAAALFTGLQALTPGLSISLSGIDKERWKVLVETPDGPIPLDLLSQGMRSTYNWVGELYRRLFDTYPDSLNPELEPALVLIDELDAHLHPEWQQQLAPKLIDLFPQAQVLATSHSPLVISSLQTANVIVASRASEADRATLRRRKLKAQHLRADQILTSDLFGLRTSRSDSFQERIERYASLAGKRDRTMSEEAELLALRNELSAGLTSGETPAERQNLDRLHEDMRALESVLQDVKATPTLDERLVEQIAQLRRGLGLSLGESKG
jgi:hypothetical protein